MFFLRKEITRNYLEASYFYSTVLRIVLVTQCMMYGHFLEPSNKLLFESYFENSIVVKILFTL